MSRIETERGAESAAKWDVAREGGREGPEGG